MCKRSSIVALVVIALFVLACDLGSLVGTPATPVVVVITATPVPPTATPYFVVVTATPPPATPLPPTATTTATKAATPTSTLTPTPKPTPNFPLTFSDDFSNDESGLDVSGQLTYVYDQGEYVLQSFQENYFGARFRERPVVSDFILEVDARIVEGPDNAALGIGFRRQDGRNYYNLMINGKGEYLLRKSVNRSWQSITNWTFSPAIKTGRAMNRLKIMARGTEITLWANGQLLGTWQDTSFSEGLIALALSSPVGTPSIKVAFDNLRITTTGTTPIVLLEDNFGDKESSWGEWTRIGELKYDQGEYVAQVFSESYMVWGNYAQLNVSDFILEIDGRIIDTPELANLGVIFRYKDAANFYEFTVNANGQYALYEKIGGKWQTILGWTKSPAIKTDRATNRLKIICDGSAISLYINNTFLGMVQDDSLDKGKLGLSAEKGKGSGTVKVAFDNLRLYTSAGAAPVVVAPPTPIPTTGAPAGIPPGVYVNSMFVEPADLKNGQFPTFHVSFINNTPGTVYYKWFVKIYEPNQRNSFGETAKVDSTLPRGTSSLASAANWKAVGGSPCRQYIARVFYVAADGTILEFPKPGGDSYWHHFSVCQ